MRKYRPSVQALGALFLTVKISELDICLEESISKINSNYEEIRECAFDVYLIWQKIRKSQLKSISKKFSLRKYSQIGLLKLRLPTKSE